ncbi:hypothetical protein BKA65DRAFT_517916 [Rhexocercosporidium sp. MPI-PUGE-AT-0058]|nr:hypothetical protein BKA65DRAFT_517916 [Rhexocercosporidium sp. MPI-PUGE-AT-0058]
MGCVDLMAVSESVYPTYSAFEILNGQLKVLMRGKTRNLLQDDVLFIPRNTSYKYSSDVA